MRTHARAPAVAAVTPLAIMLADVRAPAVLAPAPLAVMRADARAPAVLAGAPLAVMRADARAPTVLAFALFAPLAVMLAGARDSQSLQRRVLQRLCWQNSPSGERGHELLWRRTRQRWDFCFC